MKRRVKDALKKQLARVFHLGQRFGVDILPRHFYSEIPLVRKLHMTEHWRQPFSMCGIQGWNADDQLHFIESAMCEDTRRSLASRDVFAEACVANNATGYGPIEAEFLYAFVRQHRPPRIVQVGCGISTSVCLAAAQDAAYQSEITCIDPYPTSFLREAERARYIRLIQSPVETLDLGFLGQLSNGCFFFVDSTHTLGPAGEVTRIILEVLPR
ncbi:MAG TPA: class I SAM-dependent methyltransferase, partial [Lacipirellulaceae bacterium]